MEIRDKIGLDTGFFVKLLLGFQEAAEVYNRIIEGEVVDVVSVIVVFELRRLALRGLIDRQAYEVLERSWPVLFQVESVDRELALEAASISHGTGLPAAGALIYTTCKGSGSDSFYTVDPHFKAVSWKRPRIILLGEGV
ncbi:PIN domain-containing protein [Desulfurobacterium sp.]|uniref:type II toxin-antitoxin system VapC family toxin n=1 Tax=Desulfurobacterium sp. TaxID=2004706 RepID=UPI00261A568F|nr:PIN domain-containing protein [Desulfurobacterium sp.]